MIQEHWMNDMQLERFSNLFSCSSIHGITSIDTSKLLVGRLGYEPAGLTMHPPPQNDRGLVHFFCIGV